MRKLPSSGAGARSPAPHQPDRKCPLVVNHLVRPRFCTNVTDLCNPPNNLTYETSASQPGRGRTRTSVAARESRFLKRFQGISFLLAELFYAGTTLAGAGGGLGARAHPLHTGSKKGPGKSRSRGASNDAGVRCPPLAPSLHLYGSGLEVEGWGLRLER